MKTTLSNAISILPILFAANCWLTSCDDTDRPIPPNNKQPVVNQPAAKKQGCTNPTSFNFDATAEVDNGNCVSASGCLGYTSTFSNYGSIGITLFNSMYDQKMNEEVAIQRNFFNGVPAQVYILYEPSVMQRNAYASPDGQILFGFHMHYYTIQVYGELPIAGVLAHEFGHRAQQSIGWSDYTSNAQRELEADAFSGFYMAMAKQWAWSQIQGYFQNVYASGNYYFNDPAFHGTPEQRLACAYLGVNTAIGAMQSNKQYTYNELHALFLNTIRTQIRGRGQAIVFKEVVYPNGVSKEGLKRLYPKLE